MIQVVKDKFFKVLYPLYQRLLNLCEDKIGGNLIKSNYNIIKAVYLINKNYCRNFVTEDFRINNRKMEIFEEIAQEVSNNIIQGKH